MAAQIDGGIARGGKAQIENTIPCDIGSHIYTCPGAGSEAPRGANQIGHGRRVVEVDAALRPCVIAHHPNIIALAGGAIGMDA